MLGLSCLPCSDKNAFANANINLTYLTPQKQEHQKTHQDYCNPFCSCSCCGLTQSSSKTGSLELVQIQPKSSYADNYLSASTVTIALPIWQPPQLIA